MNSFRGGLYLYKKFFGMIQMGILKIRNIRFRRINNYVSKMICGEWCWRNDSAVKILVAVGEDLGLVPSMAGNN